MVCDKGESCWICEMLVWKVNDGMAVDEHDGRCWWWMRMAVVDMGQMHVDRNIINSDAHRAVCLPLSFLSCFFLSVTSYPPANMRGSPSQRGHMFPVHVLHATNPQQTPSKPSPPLPSKKPSHDLITHHLEIPSQAAASPNRTGDPIS